MKAKLLKTACLSLFTVMALGSTSAHAHFPWLNLTDSTIDKGESCKMNVGWGHAYPLGGFLTNKDVVGVTIHSAMGGEPKVSTVNDIEYEPSEGFSKEGTYLIATERKSGFYTKTTSGGKRSSKKGLENVIKCSYSHMYAKAVLNVGQEGGKADHPVGHDIEIIPQVDPISLRAGDYMPVQMTVKGKPYSGMLYATYVGFSNDKNVFAYAVQADKKGHAEVKILQAGTWLLKVQEEFPYPNQEECDVESYVAALTFEVK